jgi:hypothetical protein
MLDDFDVNGAVAEFMPEGTYRLIPRENYELGLPVCIIDDDKNRLIYRA